MEGAPDYAFLAVFDGHGGSLISREASKRIVNSITATDAWKADCRSLANIQEALVQGFLDLDQELTTVRRGERGWVGQRGTCYCSLPV